MTARRCEEESDAQVLSTDLFQFCSNSPAGSGSNYVSGCGCSGDELFYCQLGNFTLPLNVSTYDLERIILSALPAFPSLDRMNQYCRGEWVPHDEDCFGTRNEAAEAAADTALACLLLGGTSSYIAEQSSRGWCAVGSCELEDASSSSGEASSSSEEISSSSEELASSSSAADGCPPYPLSSVPANPLNACFSKDGRCYKCNPSRGSECGYDWLWIYDYFNSANIGFWYTEIACGGGSNECSDNSFLSKKTFEKNSENAWNNENNSDYIWRSKSKVFYDAAGRKTGAHPETRRYLFLPRDKTFGREQRLRLSGSNSFLLKTNTGFVSAEHKYTASWSFGTLENCACPAVTWIDLKIPLSFKTNISNIEHKNDSLLKIHEDKHIEIYNSLGNYTWEKTIQVNYCESYEYICSRYKEKIKSEFEAKLTTLINAQNKWDEDDENNISHERIDLQQKLNEMYQEVNNFDCPQIP